MGVTEGSALARPLQVRLEDTSEIGWKGLEKASTASYIHIERSNFSLSWTVGVVFGTVERFLRPGEIELVISKFERTHNNASDTLGAVRFSSTLLHNVFSIQYLVTCSYGASLRDLSVLLCSGCNAHEVRPYIAYWLAKF